MAIFKSIKPVDQRRLAAVYGRISEAFAELAAITADMGQDGASKTHQRDSANFNLLAVQAQLQASDAERRAGLRA